jgi:AcrR family transcriptional regulator
MRSYRLGRRQAAVDRTRSTILAAARDLLTALGPGSSLGKVAERAGVSRITVYNHFGSKALLFQALAAGARPNDAGPLAANHATPREQLKSQIAQACATWAADPALYRRLFEHGSWSEEDPERDRTLAEALASADQLRPGCSIKEAEDVIGILTSFQAFDRLHKGGRRSPAAVGEILTRMAASAVLI